MAQELACTKCAWVKPVKRGRPPKKCPDCGARLVLRKAEPPVKARLPQKERCPVKVSVLTVTQDMEVAETPVEVTDEEIPAEPPTRNPSQPLTDKEQRKLQELLEGRY